GAIHLLRFDGSGFFRHTGDGSNGFEGKPSFNGRGIEMISPSSLNHSVSARGLACLVHNGNLFYVGCTPVHDINVTNSPWRSPLDWTVTDHNISAGGTDAGTNLHYRRIYSSFAIQKRDVSGKEKRIIGRLARFHNPTTLQGIAPDRECTHANDAISWHSDIIYANMIDLIRFPGGSGTPQLIESTLDVPSHKSLTVYPTSGFIGGEAVGEPSVFMLTSSGVIKTINYVNGTPSGTTSIIDLTDVGGISVRTSNMRARVI